MKVSKKRTSPLLKVEDEVFFAQIIDVQYLQRFLKKYYSSFKLGEKVGFFIVNSEIGPSTAAYRER